MNAFRVRHLEDCLVQYDRVTAISLPLDRFLITYFKANPKIDSLDKSWISQQAYELLRWKGLIDHSTVPPVAWYSRLKTFYCSQRWKVNTQNSGLPEHTRVSFPESLFTRIASSLGNRRAFQTCLVLDEAPPRFLKVNVNRISRDRIFRFLLNKGVPVEKCATSPIGLQLTVQQRLKDLPEFNEGLIDIQDESSQLMAMKVNCKPRDTVLDFCCGSGGKLILHDVNPTCLTVAKLRLRRAGVKGGHFILAGDESLQRFKGKCDWVVCDVPCSGTGSLRRNPELKWHYTDDWLRKMLDLQREIIVSAMTYLKTNGGRLVYMTQSILDEENAQQIRHFCLSHKLRLVEEPFHSLPLSRGMDGFFCAVLEKIPPAICIEDTATTPKRSDKNKTAPAEIDKEIGRLSFEKSEQRKEKKEKKKKRMKENELNLNELNDEMINTEIKENDINFDDIDIELFPPN